jgi:alanine racemase
MGIDPSDLDPVLAALEATPTIAIEGVYTHFPVAESADPSDRAYSLEQLRRFDEVLARVRVRGLEPPLIHAANSAAALALPDSRRTMARVGLALYGHLPDASLGAILEERGLCLRPAMSLHARVTAVRELDAGERPSYGRLRPLQQRSVVATVPFGYADGYPRRLFPAGAQVLINNRRHDLAGAVTMDQLVIDCDGASVSAGDPVILLGASDADAITAEDWARWNATITWEILCGIGARVPRVIVA